ncbi:MAG: helix-turn-helix domain-containing protein [Paracoccaceae bacterium]|nr:helix-turn-helix domain-containing protein [Paracoccaceae bacterium]MDE2916716.1 helix-turn-helix domain-containing protein [Paracoccaceae bacterium]
MTIIRIKVDPKDPSTFPKGRIDYAKVDATTEEDIERHKAEDRAEELQEMARYIRQLRQKMNLSQIEFAHCIKVSPSTIKSWEAGKRFPSRTSYSRLRNLDRGPDAV